MGNTVQLEGLFTQFKVFFNPNLVISSNFYLNLRINRNFEPLNTSLWTYTGTHYINFSKDLERRTRGHFGPTKFLFLSSIPFPAVLRHSIIIILSLIGWESAVLTQAFNVASPAVHLTRVYKQYKQTAALDVRNSCTDLGWFFFDKGGGGAALKFESGSLGGLVKCIARSLHSHKRTSATWLTPVVAVRCCSAAACKICPWKWFVRREVAEFRGTPFLTVAVPAYQFPHCGTAH